MDLVKGGRGAIERMVEAYGFSTRQALCEQLGVSKSTLATRYMRDSFPSDWVIQCALETGVSLQWLATGEGVQFENLQTDVVALPKKKIIKGELFDSSFLLFDKAFLPSNYGEVCIIADGDVLYLSEKKFESIQDGKWIISFDNKVSVREITVLPSDRVRVEAGKSPFECSKNEIEYVYKVIGTFLFNGGSQ
ncbi:phage repressor protein CI [Serratia marcescens]|uniref:phage repressor protein CI n=1 Tax=Serratia TaxID=613 RepID=UPI00313EB670